MNAKPIPTRYKGYHFRSRLEARWAVFFDALGLEWEYEPEGFDLNGVPYLPDFRIRRGDSTWWCEVKPKGTLRDDKFELFRRAVGDEAERMLADYKAAIDTWYSKFPHLIDRATASEPRPKAPREVFTYLLLGDPAEHFEFGTCPVCAARGYPLEKVDAPFPCEGGGYGFFMRAGMFGENELQYTCEGCDITHRIRDAEDMVGVAFRKGHTRIFERHFDAHNRKVFAAAKAARSARFEYGECGAT